MTWRISLFIIICGLILFWPLLHRHVAGDVGVYSYIGAQVAEGQVPYRDAWDIKSPGIFFQYGLAVMMMGSSDMAVLIADFALAIGAAFMIFFAAARVENELTGIFAAAAWLIAYNYMHLEGWFGQPETAAALLSATLFYLALDEEPLVGWQCFLSGFVVGLLMWYKLPFILFAILLLPRMTRTFARNRAWEAIAPGFMGFMAATLPVLIYFMVSDAGKDLWEGLIVAPYLVTTTLTLTIGQQLDRLTSTVTQLVVWILPVVSAALFALGGLPKERKFQERMTWGYLILATIVVVVQQRYLMYYWILAFPPIAILAGIGASKIYHWTESITQKTWVRMAALVALMVCVNVPRAKSYWTSYMDGVEAKDRLEMLVHFPTQYGRGPTEVRASVLVLLGEQLRNLTGIEDKILSFDMDPAINFYAQRAQPTRFSYLWPLERDSFARLGWKGEYSKEIMRGKPKFIIICRDNQNAAFNPDGMKGLQQFPTLHAWFRKNYALYAKSGVIEVYAEHEQLKKGKLDLSLKLARLEGLR